MVCSSALEVFDRFWLVLDLNLVEVYLDWCASGEAAAFALEKNSILSILQFFEGSVLHHSSFWFSFVECLFSKCHPRFYRIFMFNTLHMFREIKDWQVLFEATPDCFASGILLSSAYFSIKCSCSWVGFDHDSSWFLTLSNYWPGHRTQILKRLVLRLSTLARH